MGEAIRIAKYSELRDLEESLRTGPRAIVLYGTSAMWRANPTFVPYMGQLVVWADKGTGLHPEDLGIKIGDGSAYNLDLPFVGDAALSRITALISAHVNDASAHVSGEDRRRWDNKVTTGDAVAQENLIITRD